MTLPHCFLIFFTLWLLSNLLNVHNFGESYGPKTVHGFIWQNYWLFLEGTVVAESLIRGLLGKSKVRRYGEWYCSILVSPGLHGDYDVLDISLKGQGLSEDDDDVLVSPPPILWAIHSLLHCSPFAKRHLRSSGPHLLPIRKCWGSPEFISRQI